ncbi:MAG: DUF1998 domain-containing protein, partial [Myxococcales bacterium]|nr:DUF1998 domain-containing protein [Myxococcales bacterium]
LPHHDRWREFLANLKYVVIDELHTYRGVFGSHVANVLRRLWRACAHHGARPVVVACSATIANPGALATALCGGREFVQIDRDASPAGPRTFIVLNPPVVDRITGVRRDYLKVTRAVANVLRTAGVTTLAFCRTRKAVELLTRYLREDEAGVDDRGTPVDGAALSRAEKAIRGYRGGYLPGLRREVEGALQSGEARMVAATNALELGVDIGGLDAVVLAGYPGTRAATWQRSGRAGRRQDASLTVMVLSSSPLDQFVANGPGFLFDQPPEHARIDPDNPEILVPHLRCAAYELPIAEGEALAGVAPDELAPALEYLAEAGALHREPCDDGARYFAIGVDFPADRVELRGSLEENFSVLEDAGGRGNDGKVLAEVDFEDAPLYLHPGAIYPLEGRTYEVVRLDWDARKAFVRAVRATYYTEAVTQKKVRIVEPIAGDPKSAGVGHAHVVRAVPGFKKLRFRTHENIGFGPINLPDLELHTVAAYWSVPASMLEGKTGLADPGLRASVAIAAAHAIHHCAAMVLMCDARDLGRAVAACPIPGGWAPVLGSGGRVSAEARLAAGAVPCIYLHDTAPGGIGLATQAYALGPALFEHVLRVVDGCACVRGCPTCIGPSALEPAELPGAPKLTGSLRHHVIELLHALRERAVA